MEEQLLEIIDPAGLESWRNFGLVGLVVGVVLAGASGLIWWAVRGMRADMRFAISLSQSAMQANISYAQTIGREQTDTLVALTKSLQQLTGHMMLHEERIERYRMEMLQALESQTKTFSQLLKQAMTNQPHLTMDDRP